MAMKYTTGVEEVSMETPHWDFCFQLLAPWFYSTFKNGRQVTWRFSGVHPAKAGYTVKLKEWQLGARAASLKTTQGSALSANSKHWFTTFFLQQHRPDMTYKDDWALKTCNDNNNPPTTAIIGYSVGLRKLSANW